MLVDGSLSLHAQPRGQKRARQRVAQGSSTPHRTERAACWAPAKDTDPPSLWPQFPSNLLGKEPHPPQSKGSSLSCCSERQQASKSGFCFCCPSGFHGATPLLGARADPHVWLPGPYQYATNLQCGFHFFRPHPLRHTHSCSCVPVLEDSRAPPNPLSFFLLAL